MTSLSSESSHQKPIDGLASLLEDCRAPQVSVEDLRCRWADIAKYFLDHSCLFGPSELPDDLVGQSADMTPVGYHAECLSTIDWLCEPLARVPEKVRYHLCMLGHALIPFDERFLPVVSIIIPASEVRTGLQRSLASCLEQTYSNLEVIVVGDGSLESVRRLDSRVRWVGGIGSASEARNAGLAAASGEFIHLLDPGDELIKTAIERKVRAFSEVCDARLCYSHVRFVSRADREQLEFHQCPLDNPCSFTGDPMLATTSRVPFQASTVMIPSWFGRQIGEFETDLGFANDNRYWFRMACEGMKAIAVKEPMTLWHAREPSRIDSTLENLRDTITADLRSGDELASQPRQYRYLVPLITRVTWLLERAIECGMPCEELGLYQQRLVELEIGLGADIPSAAEPAAILTDQLVFMLRRKRHAARKANQPVLAYWDEREHGLLQRLRNAPKIGGADLRRWLPDLPPQPFENLGSSEAMALKFALEQLQVSVMLGELGIGFRTLLRIGADFPGHPYEFYWNGAARLARVLGDEKARKICRQKFFEFGAQWLGRARQLLSNQRAAA